MTREDREELKKAILELTSATTREREADHASLNALLNLIEVVTRIVRKEGE